MQPVTYPEVNALLGELLVELQSALGAKLVGLYLYGSLVMGGFDPQVSDVDLLAVLTSDLDQAEQARLAALHSRFAHAHPDWDDRIEVAYLSLAALQTFRTQASPIGIISPGEPFHVKEAGHDWLVNWYMVRERGHVLYGPPAATVIPPISLDEFLQDVADHLRVWPEWVEHFPHRRPPEAYAVLTMCRGMYTLRYRQQVSKQRAAAWAIGEYPEWSSLIQRALLWRATAREQIDEDDEAFAEVVRFIDFANQQIDIPR